MEVTKEQFFEQIEQLTDYQPNDIELLNAAFDFGLKAHGDQKRANGDNYFLAHPVNVGLHLAELDVSAQMVAAGLLHDTLEDTPITESDLVGKFGEDITQMVEGVTKLGQIKYHGRERHAESLRKFFVAASQDARVLVLKLCDRWHNLETLQYLPPEKQQRIASESIAIHGAIASRLNMGKLSNTLCDLAFPYAMPDEYAKTLKLQEESLSKADKIIEDMYRSILGILTVELGYHPKIDRRKKGLYSLYKKLKRKNWKANQIFDIIAIRVIVESESDCYKALGIIHSKWKPVPGRVKDYIAVPKPNGYRSIHTTVFTGRGGVLEVQIRTQAMHNFADFGVASHHSYKTKDQSSSFDWLSQLEQIDGQMESTDEYLLQLKTDIFADRIFAMTPKGDVIDLPAGASVLDFAFAIHSQIGMNAKGAYVNGVYKALKTKLQTEDIVEVVQAKKTRPNATWLEWTVTDVAHTKIKRVLKA